MRILLVYDMSPEAIHFYNPPVSLEEVEKLKKIQGSYSNTVNCTDEQEQIHEWLSQKMVDWQEYHIDSSTTEPLKLPSDTLVFHCGMAL